MAGPEDEDSDRAAILARRRRFIALAISGLASAGCKRTNSPGPGPGPQACLNMMVPEEGPFVEDPGTPVTEGEGESSEGEGNSEGESTIEMSPEPCLRYAAPQPCLDVPAAPQVCLEFAEPPPNDKRES